MKIVGSAIHSKNKKYVIARLSKKGVPLPIVMCQKFKITWFPVIFPFLWTHGLHQFKKKSKNFDI